MTLTPTEAKAMIEAIKKAAAEATQGEWQADGNSVRVLHSKTEWRTLCLSLTTIGPRDEVELEARAKADSRYVATANPSALTDLLAYFEQVEVERDEIIRGDKAMIDYLYGELKWNERAISVLILCTLPIYGLVYFVGRYA